MKVGNVNIFEYPIQRNIIYNEKKNKYINPARDILNNYFSQIKKLVFKII